MKIKLSIIQAYNLPPLDKINNLADPYCLVGFRKTFDTSPLKEKEVKFKTKTKKRTLNPIWNENVELEIEGNEEFLILSVFDWDAFKTDDYAGTSAFSLYNLEKGKKKLIYLNLDLPKENTLLKQLDKGYELVKDTVVNSANTMAEGVGLKSTNSELKRQSCSIKFAVTALDFGRDEKVGFLCDKFNFFLDFKVLDDSWLPKFGKDFMEQVHPKGYQEGFIIVQLFECGNKFLSVVKELLKNYEKDKKIKEKQDGKIEMINQNTSYWYYYEYILDVNGVDYVMKSKHYAYKSDKVMVYIYFGAPFGDITKISFGDILKSFKFVKGKEKV